jgi:hypothetical protein
VKVLGDRENRKVLPRMNADQKKNGVRRNAESHFLCKAGVRVGGARRAVAFAAGTNTLSSLVVTAILTCVATTIRTCGVQHLWEYEAGPTHPLVVNGWCAGEEIGLPAARAGNPGSIYEEKRIMFAR